MEYRALATSFADLLSAPDMLRRLGLELGWIVDDDDDGWTEEELEELEEVRQLIEENRRQSEAHRIYIAEADHRYACILFQMQIEQVLATKVRLCWLRDSESIQEKEQELADEEAALMDMYEPEGFIDYWLETTGQSWDDFLVERYMNPMAENERLQALIDSSESY